MKMLGVFMFYLLFSSFQERFFGPIRTLLQHWSNFWNGKNGGLIFQQTWQNSILPLSDHIFVRWFGEYSSKILLVLFFKEMKDFQFHKFFSTSGYLWCSSCQISKRCSMYIHTRKSVPVFNKYQWIRSLLVQRRKS